MCPQAQDSTKQPAAVPAADTQAVLARVDMTLQTVAMRTTGGTPVVGDDGSRQWSMMTAALDPPTAPPSRFTLDQPDWPRPAVTVGACLEAGAGWLLMLFGGLACLIVLLVSLQGHEAQAMRDARLAVALHDIGSRLEADLAIGVGLTENTRAQRLLEEAIGRDSSLVSAEVFDPAGQSLFNTDRGSIGEQVPLPWLEAAEAAARRDTWVATATGERTIGLPLRGPFGEVAGHVSLSAPPVPRSAPFDFVVLAPLFAGLALWAGWQLLRRALRQSLDEADPAPMNEASARLAATQGRLDGILKALVTSEADRA